jgi:hypothetical protein
LLALLDSAATDSVQLDGDPKIISAIVGLTDQPHPAFAIITP